MESIHWESIQTLKGYFWEECINNFFIVYQICVTNFFFLVSDFFLYGTVK